MSEIKHKMKTLVDKLKDQVERRDWRGVVETANDLRVLQALRGHDVDAADPAADSWQQLEFGYERP